MDNVRKFFDISTGHISPSSRDFIEAAFDRQGTTLTVSMASEYGWLVVVSDRIGPDVPTDIRAVVNLARANDCAYVLFDRDGPEIDELPLMDD